MQVEETFMQHVILHWQGSVTVADGATAMKSGLEASAYSSPLDAAGDQADYQGRRVDRQGGQVDRQGGQVDHQGVQVDRPGHDASSLSGSHPETTELPVAGKHPIGKPFLAETANRGLPISRQGLPFRKMLSAFRQALLCLSTSTALPFSKQLLFMQCNAMHHTRLLR